MKQGVAVRKAAGFNEVRHPSEHMSGSSGESGSAQSTFRLGFTRVWGPLLLAVSPSSRPLLDKGFAGCETGGIPPEVSLPSVVRLVAFLVLGKEDSPGVLFLGQRLGPPIT